MGAYAVSDLHGCWEQWNEIRKFLKDDDKLYVLGDCIDRQPGGLAILEEAITDHRCTVLCGNHEDMMMEALKNEILYDESDYWTWCWFSNGGNITFEEWKEAGRDFGWIKTIKELPLWAEYVNQEGDKIIMSHSGATPKSGWSIDSLSRKTLLWDRDCLRERSWHREDNEYAVFGHTPIQIMDKYCGCGDCKQAPLVFCDGHKINIDNGACWNRQVCLLNLDTFDKHIFEV